MKRNKELADFFRNRPCEICGVTERVSGHHIITFGSRPDLDIPQNMKSLCVEHHNEIHQGLNGFIAKYGLFFEMLDRGFRYNKFSNKWFFNNENEV